MTRRYAVATWLFELGPSGATARLATLLRALPPLLAADEEVLLLGGRDAPHWPGLRGVATGIPAAPTWRRALAEQWRLPGLLRDLGANLLHLESLPVPRRLPCPVALTVHDLRDLGPYRRRSSARFRLTLRSSARRAAALFVPSQFTAGELGLVAPHRDVSVVPGAIELPQRAGARAPGDLLLHVGHLEPRKNLELLLRAHAAAAEHQAVLPLVLVGRDAGAGAGLRRLAQTLGSGDRVRFSGDVSDAALEQFYRQARAVLVPSCYEGFGMPALEALARGIPLVVSDQPALVELVGDAATVAPRADTAAWACAIQTACTEPAPANEAGVIRARDYEVSRVAARLLGHWRRITKDAL